VRLTVRVQPDARQTRAGGRYGSGEPPVLVIRVAAPPTDGRANQACIEALAAALNVPRRAVTIVSGKGTRTKLVEVDGADPAVVAQLLQSEA
jgi:uncharacterized protein